MREPESKLCSDRTDVESTKFLMGESLKSLRKTIHVRVWHLATLVKQLAVLRFSIDQIS
jgi:hypothetical protein